MWSNIKSILSDNTTKCIIVEDGEPKYVVLTFEVYQQLQSSRKDSIVRENPEKHNLQTENNSSDLQDPLWAVNNNIQEIREEGIRLEDLPF